jgi:hypothetical protein
VTGSERAEVNRFLAKHGFGLLSDKGLMPQLALCIEDETTLKRILNLTTPEERTTCYESLRPFLRFNVRPLDVLLSEIAMDAEIRQLPVIRDDGSFRAFNVPEVQTAVDKAVATGTLELNCHRCLKFEAIPAISRAFGEELAREKGWTSTHGVTRCPACSELMKLHDTVWQFEVQYAMDETRREVPDVKGEPADSAAKDEDGRGTSRQPEAGPREEG